MTCAVELRCAFSGDRELSPLGLGAWAFGRTGWGTQDDRDSRAAILRAIELGVTWIDTAAVYGDGHSEELVGRVMRELPESDRPLVFTKCGVRVDPATGATFRDLSPRSLREECDASLRRLGTEAIDLYQLHWPVQNTGIVEQAWLTLAELQLEGKVRHIGVSNFDPPLMDLCDARRSIESVQLPLSLLSRDACHDRLPWAAERKVTALAYSPLESGLLSGSFGAERLASLPEGDRRREREQFQGARLDRTLSLLEGLQPIASRLEATLAEVAIAWTLAWPGVSGAIVGARGAPQVDGWIKAAELVLDDSTLAEIAAALTESGAGEGPVAPHTGL
jgi:aryl-alcohol dehydrogenase-like predicted oxidoreductase